MLKHYGVIFRSNLLYKYPVTIMRKAKFAICKAFCQSPRLLTFASLNHMISVHQNQHIIQERKLPQAYQLPSAYL